MIKLLIGADILSALVFGWRFSNLPGQIPLYYSRPWGESQIVDFWFIFLLPILMNLIFFFNVFFINKFFKGNNTIENIFKAVNICLIVGFTGIFLRILFLVT